MTHHPPSRKSVHSKYERSLLNPAFASDLEALIEQYQPALWIHGHLHDSVYRIGRARLICNPRGYFPHELNPDFNPTMVVEV